MPHLQPLRHKNAFRARVAIRGDQQNLILGAPLVALIPLGLWLGTTVIVNNIIASLTEGKVTVFLAIAPPGSVTIFVLVTMTALLVAASMPPSSSEPAPTKTTELPMTSNESKPYETVVHMFTIFFYVLMSLALKEILTTKDFHEKDQQWPCFIAAVFLFARFLFGSSSHLYAEHAEGRTKNAIWFFILHLSWIMIFALVGTGMCFAENVHDFLVRNIWFGAIAVFASICDLIGEGRQGVEAKERWAPHWIWFNSIHTAVSIICLKWFAMPDAGKICPWSLPLVALFVVLGGLLLFDFKHQLEKLGKAFENQQKAKAAATGGDAPAPA